MTEGTLPQSSTKTYNNLNLDAQNFSFIGTFPFTVSGSLPAGGSLSANGTAGPLNAQDASLTPITATISMKHIDLVAAGFVPAEQGIAGIADLDTKVVSNGQSAQANGKVHLSQVKLAKGAPPSPAPVDVQFSVEQNLQELSGKIDSATVQIGKASATLSGTYQTAGNTTVLAMQADGQNMPIDELVAFLPSLGVQLPSGARLHGGNPHGNAEREWTHNKPGLQWPGTGCEH